MLIREFIAWCEIFNEYSNRLDFFYQQIKVYKPTLNGINQSIEEIKKVKLLNTENATSSNR
jgi:hypothetical protein